MFRYLISKIRKIVHKEIVCTKEKQIQKNNYHGKFTLNYKNPLSKSTTLREFVTDEI